jgi:F-type H+-transporting ATPase subunit epsilon
MTGLQTSYWLAGPYAENPSMPTFQLSLISPEKLLFEEQVDQVDLPGAEGDLGVLPGHAAIVTVLRPGIVTVSAGAVRDTFIVLGGVAEFSDESLTVLAEFAAHVDDFDVGELEARIEEMEGELAGMPAGQELDQAVVRLDHYKSVRANLAQVTAF